MSISYSVRKARTKLFCVIKKKICSFPGVVLKWRIGRREKRSLRKRKPMMRAINWGLRREIPCSQELLDEFLEHICNI